MSDRPKPTPAQLGMIVAGAVAGAVVSLVIGVGGAIGGGIIGLGAALGGMPYFRAVQEWKEKQD